MSPTLIVYRKELKEMLRDKRVRNSAIVMPALLVLGVLAMFGFISGIGEKQNQKITIVKSNNDLVKDLRGNKVQITEVASVEDGKKLIRQGKARLVLSFPDNFDESVKAGRNAKIQAYYDPQQTTGMIALRALEEQVDKLNEDVRNSVLEKNNISKESIAPISIEEQKVKVGGNDASEMLVSMLPYLIVIWAFYGGMGSAADLVSGEKEKSTLETLLIAPVGRSQVAFGKFFALMTICFLSSFSALVGFIFAGLSGAPLFAKLFPKGLGIGAPEIGTILLILIPTVAFFASLLIAISTYAKNPREAQSYLALVSFVVIMPAVFGQIIGFTDLSANWWIRAIPVLNTSVALREALQGKSTLFGVGLTIGVGAILALIGIRIAVSLFKREQVLVRI
jgi:sodium transport system permease protein